MPLFTLFVKYDIIILKKNSDYSGSDYMFNFFKTKKGFTFVELMIAVLILGILIAVAVPTYTSITKKSAKKVCIANQRDIVLQLNTFATTNKVSLEGNIMCTSTGEEMDSLMVMVDDVDGKIEFDEDTFTSLFDEMPYCPSAGAYDITIEPAGLTGSKGSIKVTIFCEANEDGIDHYIE